MVSQVMKYCQCWYLLLFFSSHSLLWKEIGLAVARPIYFYNSLLLTNILCHKCNTWRIKILSFVNMYIRQSFRPSVCPPVTHLRRKFVCSSSLTLKNELEIYVCCRHIKNVFKGCFFMIKNIYFSKRDFMEACSFFFSDKGKQISIINSYSVCNCGSVWNFEQMLLKYWKYTRKMIKVKYNV